MVLTFVWAKSQASSNPIRAVNLYVMRKSESCGIPPLILSHFDHCVQQDVVIDNIIPNDMQSQ